jgi:hypothetical protein
MLERHQDAWMQPYWSARHGLFAQLRHRSAATAALAIAELSTTGAFAARMSCLLCRGLLSCGPAVFANDNDACPLGSAAPFGSSAVKLATLDRDRSR